MSSSGSFNASSVTVSGGGNPGNFMFVNWQIGGVNVGGNFTQINWQAYFHFNGDDAQLDNGLVNTNVGNVYSNGGRVYNFASNFSTRDLGIASGSFNVGADANGNSQLQFGLQMVVFSSGTSNGTSGVWNIDRIALAPGISALTVDTIKPTTVRLGGELSTIGHGTSCNLEMFYRLQGSGTWISLGTQGDAAGFNYWNPTGLKPGKTYEYIMNATNNNGDFAQSGIQTFNTKPVSGMISILRAM